MYKHKITQKKVNYKTFSNKYKLNIYIYIYIIIFYVGAVIR